MLLSKVVTRFVMGLILQFQPPNFHLAHAQSQQGLLAEWNQLALETQEQRKSGGQARREGAKENCWTKRLEPRKERLSQLLDDFPELLEDEESQPLGCVLHLLGECIANFIPAWCLHAWPSWCFHTWSSWWFYASLGFPRLPLLGVSTLAQ